MGTSHFMNGPPKRSFALVKNKLGYHPNTSGSIIHNRTLIIGMVIHAHGGIDCPQRTFEPLPPMLELLDPPPHGGTDIFSSPLFSSSCVFPQELIDRGGLKPDHRNRVTTLYPLYTCTIAHGHQHVLLVVPAVISDRVRAVMIFTNPVVATW